MTEPQAIEGYGCSCGEKLPTLKEFRSHQMRGNNQDGKGSHLSIGRVNMQTGEVTMPPWNQRTPEQKQASRHAQKTPAEKGKVGRPATIAAKQTDHLGQASQISFVPRVFTTTYTPIMQASQAASREIWGWPDLTLEDFLDTVLHLFFKEKGVILAGYFIDETREQRAEREEMLSKRGNGDKATEPASEPIEPVEPEEEPDIRLKTLQKMVEQLAENKPITPQDLHSIMEEVSNDS